LTVSLAPNIIDGSRSKGFAEMNIALPPEFVPFVDRLVAAGSYSTREDVVRDALAQMCDRQSKFESLKASIEEGIAELDRTGGAPLDFEEIKRKGRERLAANRKHS
jgi:putative addiction module CopG family antidote